MSVFTTAYAKSLPKFNRGVSLVSWAYNEEELIEDFLCRADALMSACVEDYEIVVVDDGSTDRTPQILAYIASKNPRIRILTNDINRNVGYSSRRAVCAASKEYLLWQTVDWSYDISLLRIFLELLKQYDVVAGVRRAPVQLKLKLLKPVALFFKLFGIEHLTKRSDSVGKAIVSIVNYSLIRLLFRIPLSDYQNVVIYPSRIIQSITVEANSSFVNPEILFKTYNSGASIVEVPVNFISRSAGEAKGTKIKSLIASLKDILKFWFLWVVCGRPNTKSTGSIERLDPSQWEIVADGNR